MTTAWCASCIEFSLRSRQGVRLPGSIAISILTWRVGTMTNANFRRTLVGAAVAAALGVLAILPLPRPIAVRSTRPISRASTSSTSARRASRNPTAGMRTPVSAPRRCSAPTRTSFPRCDTQLHGPADLRAPRDIELVELFGLYVYGGQIDSFDTALHSPTSGDRIRTPRQLVDPVHVGSLPAMAARVTAALSDHHRR